MRKIILSFCILIFGVSVAIADAVNDVTVRLVNNCKERARLNGSTSNNLTAECLVKLENIIAQQGPDAAFREYQFVWSPQEPMEKLLTRLWNKIIQERGYTNIDQATMQKIQDESLKLSEKDDYVTLGCLYANRPNTRCLKD